MTRLALPSPPPAEWSRRLAAARATTTLVYQVKLITPMYGGGVEKGKPELAQPFRARSIKGQLRWWWRTLLVAGEFDVPGDAPLSKLSSDQIRELEAQLWGMLDEVRPQRSKVDLHITGIANVEVFPYESRQLVNGRQKWVSDPRVAGLAYAYFPAQHQVGQPPRNLVAAGASFELQIVVHDDGQLAMVEAVVRAWATFGGVGGRTRRGAGAIAVLQAGRLLCDLDDAQHAPVTARCLTPVTRGDTTSTNEPLAGSAKLAHELAVECLRRYRQGPGLGRNGPLGRSHWPEPDAVRRRAGHPHWLPRHAPAHAGGDHFPRAAFGMPLKIAFMQDVSQGPVDLADMEPLPRTLVPVNQSALANDDSPERMASPLILRPVAVQLGNQIRYWQVAALIERHPFRQQSQARLQGPTATAETVNLWSPGWRAGTPGGYQGIKALEASPPSADLYPNPTNAVEAFMNYFLAR